MPHHNRHDYSPLTERKDYSWPGGKRLAFCITTNIECFAFGKGRGHDNAKHGEPQTQRNYSWRDYGNRIGIMDWPHDDQPIWMRTRSGPILSVPYPAELNDSPQIVHRQHTGREFCDMLVDQFEEMAEQSEKHPLVCNISIHPYVFGYPFRLRPLRKALSHSFSNKFVNRVWKCKPEDVADYCLTLKPGIVPGS